MVKGSDGQDYPDHLIYECMYCHTDVDPAYCWVDDYGQVVLHTECVEEFEEID
jgi:hypothetical protein